MGSQSSECGLFTLLRSSTPSITITTCLCNAIAASPASCSTRQHHMATIGGKKERWQITPCAKPRNAQSRYPRTPLSRRGSFGLIVCLLAKARLAPTTNTVCQWLAVAFLECLGTEAWLQRRVGAPGRPQIDQGSTATKARRPHQSCVHVRQTTTRHSQRRPTLTKFASSVLFPAPENPSTTSGSPSVVIIPCHTRESRLVTPSHAHMVVAGHHVPS